MAKRHFDEKGFPKLKEITFEICEYVKGLEIKLINENPYFGNILDFKNQIIEKDVIFNYPLDIKPFKVKRIYVVGEQVKYLPNSYLGEHNLNLIIETNINKITTPKPEIHNIIIHNLEKTINNEKEFKLNFIIEGKLKSPYLQIYPKMKKVLSDSFLNFLK